ncbi:hypothetical protein [Andreprevotia chitinilytica]|uniref:hypothetical protein n=1 Tax=Andreprevotia chitinilytica TaxID=396808 RepID=UPI00054F4F6E|nr:hypothetical protein [Andreprevotia chitinilytica]
MPEQRRFTLAPKTLALLLSDLEAGTPRQWYWLEIADALPAVTTTSGKVRFTEKLLGHVGFTLSWPWLQRQALPGIGLYERVLRPVWRRAAEITGDGALCAAALPALLAGFGRLPALQAFLVWLLALFGCIWQGWRFSRTAPSPRIVTDEEEAPGPEASVGLAGQLLAADVPPTEALRLVVALRADAAAAWPALLPQWPELAPPAPTAAPRFVLGASGWLAGTLPVALGLSFLPAPFGLPVGVAAVALVTAQCKGRLSGGLVLLAGLIAFALGRLGHVV